MIRPQFYIRNPKFRYPYILDKYPAAVAYSLRKLSSKYTGNCIEVRRTSDDTTQNIGLIGDNLDTESLESFCSGTDGYIKTWYDQSGNENNATQTTTAYQPQIVSSGSVLTKNNMPAIYSNGVAKVLRSSGGFGTLTKFNLYVVAAHNQIGTTAALVSGTNGGSYGGGQSWFIGRQYNSQNNFRISYESELYNGSATTNQNLFFYAFNGGTSITHGVNGVDTSLTSGIVNSIVIDVSLELFGILLTTPALSANCYMQEVVFFTKKTTRTNIESDINNYYSIY